MKHLKKYNEANAFTFDPNMDLIKEIILELKHDIKYKGKKWKGQ